MLSFLSFISALWVGTLISICSFIVPLLFKYLDKATAAKIAGEVFYTLNAIGLFCSILIVLFISSAVKSSSRQLFSGGIFSIAKRCRVYALWVFFLISVNSGISYIMYNMRYNHNFILLSKFNDIELAFKILHTSSSIIYGILIFMSIFLYFSITKLLQSSSR